MSYIKAFILLCLSSAFLWFLDGPRKLGSTVLPPLGRLLDPVNGFWANAEKETHVPDLQVKPGRPYGAPVQVVYDSRRVPHIFAASDADLYRAQGYVTAADRLWQMDFQTAAAAGRLSEFLYHVAGERVVEFDRLKRRSGMVWAARRTLERFEKDTLARMIVESYTEGVNDYINSLGYRHLPLEYKILDYRPEPWTPLKCALLLKYMAEMLTNDENDLVLTEAVAVMGPEYQELLFPLYPDTLLEPIMPAGTPLRDCEPDEKGKTAAATDVTYIPVGRGRGLAPSERPELGSNNWAVAGSRTRSGRPILCGDPHLSLNLPSLWYEIQLQAPGVNVYGVSLPGAPGVVIGFNDRVAWSMTNAMRDVCDWYAIRYTDASQTAIVMDDGSEPVYAWADTMRRRGADPLIDTFRVTRWGPVVYDKAFPHPAFDTLTLAMRWVAHYPGGELLTIYHINRARSPDDFLKGLSFFTCPGQNFVYADKDGNIGLFQQGVFPAFQADESRRIRNGASKSEEWPGWLSTGCNPWLYNPERGFVSSANQHPTAPDYRWVYSGDFEHFRNRRINALLAAGRDFTPESIQAVQLDNKNLMAELALPLMMAALGEEEKKEKEVVAALETWDYMNDASMVAPGLFHLWFGALETLLWDELYKRNPGCLPQEFYTIRFMQKWRDHRWYDIDSTADRRENRDDVIRAAFRQMTAAHRQWQQTHQGEEPVWFRVKNTSLRHLLPGLTPFGAEGLHIGGGKHIVNACGPRWGPSWRMIVSLEDTVRALGIFPGGPSGNPGSPWYLSSADNWAAGRYHELILAAAPDEARLQSMKRFTLN